MKKTSLFLIIAFAANTAFSEILNKESAEVPTKDKISVSKKDQTLNKSLTNVETLETLPIKTMSTTGDNGYKTALGLKFLWGVALTGKHFFKDQYAVEAIIRFRGYSGIGSDINLTALYQYHKDIKELEGLKWYAGGGIHIGNFSYKDEFSFLEGYGDFKRNNLYFGLAAVAGLEYKFKAAPIAISIDWQPTFLFKNYYSNSGFGAEGGGIGIKYTF